MSGQDPSNTNGPWRKYRCTCGYRCVGDFRAARHEHEMTLDGEAGPRTPISFYEPDVKPVAAVVLELPR